MNAFQEVIRTANKLNLDESLDKNEKVYDKEIIQNWYLNRIVQIENFTGLVDTCLNFAELGIANGCKNLTSTVENLRTLYTLTYECCKQDSETFYTLDYISKLSDIEKLSLMMSYSSDPSDEVYTKNLEEWLMPFLSRRPTLQMRENLLKEYLIKLSKEGNTF